MRSFLSAVLPAAALLLALPAHAREMRLPEASFHLPDDFVEDTDAAARLRPTVENNGSAQSLVMVFKSKSGALALAILSRSVATSAAPGGEIADFHQAIRGTYAPEKVKLWTIKPVGPRLSSSRLEVQVEKYLQQYNLAGFTPDGHLEAWSLSCIAASPADVGSCRRILDSFSVHPVDGELVTLPAEIPDKTAH